MKDVNGLPIERGELVAVLASVISVSVQGVMVRVLNSDLELGISCDEVLGVASSELQVIQVPKARA